MAVTVQPLLPQLHSNIKKERSGMWEKQWDYLLIRSIGLSGSIWEFTDEWFEGKRINRTGIESRMISICEKYCSLPGNSWDFPGNLGQHTGGFVITRGKLSDLCPIMNARMEDRTCIEWNKDDIDALGFMKIDVLALGYAHLYPQSI